MSNIDSFTNSVHSSLESRLKPTEAQKRIISEKKKMCQQNLFITFGKLPCSDLKVSTIKRRLVINVTGVRPKDAKQ